MHIIFYKGIIKHLEHGASGCQAIAWPLIENLIKKMQCALTCLGNLVRIKVQINKMNGIIKHLEPKGLWTPSVAWPLIENLHLKMKSIEAVLARRSNEHLKVQNKKKHFIINHQSKTKGK